MIRRIGVLLAIFLPLSSSFSQEGLPVTVTTQWDTASYADPIVSLFSETAEKEMRVVGSGKIFTYNDQQGCSDLLQKMFQYPLNRMKADKYISEEFYQFLMNSKTLDPRQIVFLNQGKISSQTLSDGRSLMPNLVGIFSNETRHQVASLQKMGSQWINVDGSMWVVRGHIPDRAEASFIKQKSMPWESHSEFDQFYDHSQKGKLNWEFGRAHRESTTDFKRFMQMGVQIAGKDALALNVPFSEGRVFIHAKNSKMMNHVIEKYGFKKVAAHAEDDFLLMAQLDQLVEHLGPAEYFANQAILKRFFPKTTPGKLLEAEKKIMHAFYYHLDDVSSPRPGEGIFIFNGAYQSQISKIFLDLEPNFYQIPNPEKFGVYFQDGIQAREGPSARIVTRPHSQDWGIAQLSEDRFKEDPHYLERIITELSQQNRKMIRALLPHDPTAPPDTFRGFFMATDSKEISTRARSMGATVKEVVVENESRVDQKIGHLEYNGKYKTFYTLEFSAAQAKAITQSFSISAPPASFKEGFKQVQYNHLTSF